MFAQELHVLGCLLCCDARKYFPTGHIVLPVFASADKGGYAVSVGCTITVKFNAIASCTACILLSGFSLSFVVLIVCILATARANVCQ